MTVVPMAESWAGSLAVKMAGLKAASLVGVWAVQMAACSVDPTAELRAARKVGLWVLKMAAN